MPEAQLYFHLFLPQRTLVWLQPADNIKIGAFQDVRFGTGNLKLDPAAYWGSASFFFFWLAFEIWTSKHLQTQRPHSQRFSCTHCDETRLIISLTSLEAPSHTKCANWLDGRVFGPWQIWPGGKKKRNTHTCACLWACSFKKCVSLCRYKSFQHSCSLPLFVSSDKPSQISLRPACGPAALTVRPPRQPLTLPLVCVCVRARAIACTRQHVLAPVFKSTHKCTKCLGANVGLRERVSVSERVIMDITSTY